MRTGDELVGLTKRNVRGKEILQKKEQFEANEIAFVKTVDQALGHEAEQEVVVQRNVSRQSPTRLNEP